MPRLPYIVPYVASALEQSAQGPPLDPLTLICAVVAHHLSLKQQTNQLFWRVQGTVPHADFRSAA